MLAPGSVRLLLEWNHSSPTSIPTTADTCTDEALPACASVLTGLYSLPPAVTVVAGTDTFGGYRHERCPAAPQDPAALEEHQRSVFRVYPDGYVRKGAV